LLLLFVAQCGFAQSAARPQVQLPDGPVRSVILKNCVSCHGIDDYAFHAMDRQGWQQLLDVQHKEQRGIVLSRKDERLLLGYLSENFGTESVAFPRDYVAQEISEYFDNSAARVFLEGTCTECHEIRVFEHRKDVNGWRALVLDMRERGASITDENIEKLVEWLGRVRGVNPVE
ncbi:MAG: hypothetical protein V4603_08675, partial [Pseudomonadota bacterium]